MLASSLVAAPAGKGLERSDGAFRVREAVEALDRISAPVPTVSDGTQIEYISSKGIRRRANISPRTVHPSCVFDFLYGAALVSFPCPSLLPCAVVPNLLRPMRAMPVPASRTS
jgi:hypothetical protein